MFPSFEATQSFLHFPVVSVFAGIFFFVVSIEHEKQSDIPLCSAYLWKKRHSYHSMYHCNNLGRTQSQIYFSIDTFSSRFVYFPLFCFDLSFPTELTSEVKGCRARQTIDSGAAEYPLTFVIL